MLQARCESGPTEGYIAMHEPDSESAELEKRGVSASPKNQDSSSPSGLRHGIVMVVDLQASLSE